MSGEPIIRSTVEELEQFILSRIYVDFCAELDIRIEMLTNELIDESLEYSGRQYDRARGGVKNMREMKSLFTDMVENRITQGEE